MGQLPFNGVLVCGWYQNQVGLQFRSCRKQGDHQKCTQRRRDHFNKVEIKLQSWCCSIPENCFNLGQGDQFVSPLNVRENGNGTWRLVFSYITNSVMLVDRRKLSLKVFHSFYKSHNIMIHSIAVITVI